MSGAPDRPAPAFLPLIVENLPLDDLAPYRQFVTRSSGSRHGGDARGATQQGVTSMTAQDVAMTQRLSDAAANTSSQAWMLTGHYACYHLANAQPTPHQLGALPFDPMLLRHRAARARELAAAWSAVAEAWEDAAQLVNREQERGVHGG